jgi:hypothetical protein
MTMQRRNDLEMIQRLLAAEAHVPPAVDILKSELRSDSGIEPPIPAPPSPLVYIIVKWKYHIRLAALDEFHAFLAQTENEIIADVAGLKVGAAYLGTYAELPRCTTHQTFWSYDSPDDIDRFKAALGGKKKSELKKDLKKLGSFIEDPTLTMHRLVRAGALAGLVAETRKKDPILDILAGT